MKIQWILGVVFVLKEVLTGQKRIVDKENNIIMGVQDDYPEALMNQRITDSELPIQEIKVDPDDVYDVDLGVSDWGPFQTSMLMKVYPKQFPDPSNFCQLTSSHLTYIIKAVQNVTRMDRIYDHCIFNNKIFILTTRGEILGYSIEVDSGNNPAFLPIFDKAEDSPLEVTMKEFTEEFTEALISYHRKSHIIYIPTDICLIALNAKTSTSKIIPNSVYKPNSDLVSVDIVEDYLFVAFRSKGIFIYHIPDDSSVSHVATIDHTYWNKSENDLVINDFDVHDYKIEFVNNNEKILQSQETDGTFFNVPFTNEERNKAIQKTILEREVILIAEKTGIYVLDLESLLSTGQLSTSFHRHYMSIVEPIKVTRFHDMIYVLQQDSISDSPGTVVEFFITEGNFDKWDSFDKSVDLFRINRFFYGDELERIFVDEDFLYVSSNNEHYFYERGINSTFLRQPGSITNYLGSSLIHGFEKIIINGIDYLLVIEETQITLDKVRLKSLSLRCPTELKNVDFDGSFEFQVNVTTRNCPHKMRMHLSQQEKFDKVCLFTRNFKVSSNKDLIRTKKDIWLIVLASLVLFASACVTILCMASKSLRTNYSDLQGRYQELRTNQTNLDGSEGPNNRLDDTQESSPETPQQPREKMKFEEEEFGYEMEQTPHKDVSDEEEKDEDI